MNLHAESLVVSTGRPHGPGEPLNAPIAPASTYRSAGASNPYARAHGNVALTAFEDAISALEGGSAVSFASGSAAVAAIVEGRRAGAVAVIPTAAYQGTLALFAEQKRLGRMQVRAVDPTDTAAVTTAVQGADLLWLETISNPLIAVPDLPAAIAAGREAGALVCVDATFSTPLGVRPLAFGADLVVHSATKYLGGHSDLLGGVVSGHDVEAVRARRSLTGAMPSPFDSYLALRGLRTLALRLERAQANAQALAERLVGHPRVTRVRYPGLPDDPGHDRASRDYDGFGAVLSFEVDGTAADADRVCASVALITHATSLGGVETLIERRGRYDGDAAAGAPPTLLRLAVGIEHVDDLWDDLEQALNG